MEIAEQRSTHPRSRFLGLAAFAMMLIVVTVGAPMFTSAADFRSGFTIDATPKDVKGNLFVSGFRTRIDSTIGGDLSVAAFSSTVYGTVNGDAHILGGQTTVSGTVKGTVYVTAGNVRIDGAIGHDIVVTGGKVNITSSATVGGSIIHFGGVIRNNATVTENVTGVSAVYNQQGSVGGNMDVQSDHLTVGNSATVNGHLKYQSPISASVKNEGAIKGGVFRTNATPWSGVDSGAMRPFGSMLRLVWQFLLGAAMIAIAPRLLYRIAAHGSTLVQPFIVGLVGLVALPVFAVVAIVTILGIPIGVIALILVGIALYMSQIFAGTVLGRFLLPRSWRDGSRGYLLLAMTLGMIIIGGLRMAPVPYLGLAVTALVTFLGFGTALSILMDLTSSRLRDILLSGRRV